MNMRFLAAGAIFTCAASPIFARTLEHTGVVNAPVADVWKAFTDEDEVVTWMTPLAEIDLSVGGLFRTNYNPEGEIGDPTTIVNKIISFEPERMLSMQNVQVPEGFPWELNFQQTWSVIYFEPMGPDQTRLRVVGLGYGEGGDWDTLYDYFKGANAQVLDALKKKFGHDQTEASNEGDALKTLGALVGGEWIHESETPRGVFRVRNIVSFGPDGKSLVAKGWLGSADGMFEHGATLAFHDVLTGEDRFVNVNEQGHVASGALTLGIDGEVIWHWNELNSEGEVTRYDARMHFDDQHPDRYRFTLARLGEDGEETPMVDIWYDRVQSAPEAFQKAKSATMTHR